jgi:hypothetical protein
MQYARVAAVKGMAGMPCPGRAGCCRIDRDAAMLNRRAPLLDA